MKKYLLLTVFASEMSLQNYIQQKDPVLDRALKHPKVSKFAAK